MLKIGCDVSCHFFSEELEGVVVGTHKNKAYYAVRFNQKKDFLHSCDGMVDMGFGYYVLEKECKIIKKNKYLRYLK